MSGKKRARPHRPAKVSYALTAEEATRRSELSERLRELADELSRALGTFGEALDEAWGPVEDAASAYNEALGEAREFAEDVATTRRETFEDRSERWREGDEGERASGWIEEWERAAGELDEVDLERPSAPDEPDLGHDETLDGLPEDSEG